MAAVSQPLAKLGNEAALVPCIRVGGEASPVAMKVLRVSEWGLISVDSSLAQQCLGQEEEELARSSGVCEFLCLLHVVLSLQHCKSGLSSGDSDSLVSKQNRQVRFAIPPSPSACGGFCFSKQSQNVLGLFRELFCHGINMQMLLSV